MNQFILQGKRILLRTPVEQDLPVLYQYIYGEAHQEWKEYDAPYFPLEHKTYEEFSERMYKKIASTEQPTQLYMECNGELIGMVTYYWESKDTRWLEVGIAIYNSQFWSNGYGTEALTLWIDHIFSQFEIARVGLTTWSGNPRMIRCAEKLGMQLEGRMRKCRYYNGVYYDSIRMGILREEWEAAQK